MKYLHFHSRTTSFSNITFFKDNCSFECNIFQFSAQLFSDTIRQKIILIKNKTFIQKRGSSKKNVYSNVTFPFENTLIYKNNFFLIYNFI